MPLEASWEVVVGAPSLEDTAASWAVAEKAAEETGPGQSVWP